MEKSYLSKLIAKGKTQKAIEHLLEFTENTNQVDLYNDILQVSGRFSRIENMNKKGIISFNDYTIESNKISDTLKEYIQNDLKEITIKKKSNPNDSKKVIFISYNHEDKIFALKVKESLEKKGIEVIIDLKNIKPGQEINEFINDSIKVASATICIVSKNSLLSSWVAIESMKTLNSEQITSKKFIAGYIDSSFFKRTFTDEALNKIEKEISEIKVIIQDRLKRNRNIDDIQNELVRYNNLKHDLPKIIRKLKESYTVDISTENFDSGIQQIIDVFI